MSMLLWRVLGKLGFGDSDRITCGYRMVVIMTMSEPGVI